MVDVTISYNPDAGRLIRAFETSDPIGAVVRAHAEVEQAINYVLDTLSRWVKDTRQRPRQFGKKIDRLEEYGFPAIRLDALRAFNHARIDIAHGIRERPTDGQIRQLLQSVERVFGRDLSNFTLRIRKVDGAIGASKNYTEMDGSERYAFLGAALAMGIAVFPDEIRTRLRPLIRLQ